MLERSEWIEPILSIPLGCGAGQEDAWFRNYGTRQARNRRGQPQSGPYERRILATGFAGSRTRFGRSQKFDGTPPGCYDRSAGWSSLVARWAHNPKVGGSNPPPATNLFNWLQPFGPERSAHFPLILPAIARRPARARPVSGHSRLGCKRSWSWRCWNAARVPAAPSHRCGSHVAGKNTSAGTCATPRS